MSSLRNRLILGAGLAITASLLTAGVVVFAFSRAALYAELDAALRATAQALAALTKETEDGIELGFAEFDFAEFQDPERPSYFQVWQDGKVLVKSAHVGDADLSSPVGSLREPIFYSATLPDGRRGRLVSLTFHPQAARNETDTAEETGGPGGIEDRVDQENVPPWDEKSAGVNVESHGAGKGSRALASPAESAIITLLWERPAPWVTIAVGRETSTIDRGLATLGWALTAAGLVATALSMVLLAYVVHRGLQPVHAVSQAITRIDADSLDNRVPAARVPSEIKPMVMRLNELLARLEDSFERERAFSSNVAHELRTPLAGLRTTLEVYLSRPHESTAYQEGMQACLDICNQSQTLVENLLALARVEGKPVTACQRKVAVHQLFHECWAELRASAEAKNLQTVFDIQPVPEIETDDDMLRVILRNVLNNAVSHSNRGGWVAATISNGGQSIRVEVANTGNQLSPDQVKQVFDRLWRGDQARSLTGQHFGLGLTLTKRLAEALGGTITARTESDLFRIILGIPAENLTSSG
jgi:two-component system sensor histidine kinase QseC